MIWNHQELPLQKFRVVYETLRITPKEIQNGLWITENQQRITPKIFRVVCESPKIAENHPQKSRVVHKSLRITKNCPKKFRVAHESLRINENCPQKIQSGLWSIKNHEESLRITPQKTRVVCKSSGITPKKLQSGLQNTKNHWELPKKISDWQIIKNHHKKNSKLFVNHQELPQKIS